MPNDAVTLSVPCDCGAPRINVLYDVPDVGEVVVTVCTHCDAPDA